MLSLLRSLVLAGLPLLALAQYPTTTNPDEGYPTLGPAERSLANHLPNADVAPINLTKRADGDSPSDYLDGQVSFTSWTAGDGEKTGLDPDGVPYVQTLIQMILDGTPDASERNLVYWAGGHTVRDDVDEFTESETRMPNGGRQFTDFFGQDLFDKLGIEFQSPLYWRAVRRMSKALAASATNGAAYVYLRPVCGRTIFSPPSPNPMDNDPAADGESTNGEIWYYAELPALMRNLNIDKIYTFWKPEGSRKFDVRLAWDAGNPGEHSRTSFQDYALDATPIELPGRPPSKRSLGQQEVEVRRF